MLVDLLKADAIVGKADLLVSAAGQRQTGGDLCNINSLAADSDHRYNAGTGIFDSILDQVRKELLELIPDDLEYWQRLIRYDSARLCNQFGKVFLNARQYFGQVGFFEIQVLVIYLGVTKQGLYEVLHVDGRLVHPI